MKVKCRDCGRKGREDPNDPAPSLCPDCYEKRLQRITPLFEKRIDALVAQPDFDGNITPVITWFAEALEAIGGETHEYARKHANELGHMMALMSNQRLN